MPPTPQLGHLVQELVVPMQPSPDTPKTATSRRSTQNIQTPPKSGRKPSKKPSPAACRSDKSETIKEKKQAPARGHKTQRNLAQTRPKQQPPGDRLKTSKHHLNPDANPAKNPPPQRAEVTSLKPIKEKKQAPARGHKTQRNLAQTRPKQQPPGDRLKTSKHHLSRRLKSPSSSYIFERFSLKTCASWPVKRYSELPKTITWESVHLWKNCMKCIVGSI